jgi:DNA-binding MarR family transcriptional regulator
MYADRYDLSVAEWRVMTAVGRVSGANANRVCEITAMDKVRVSRAVARLMKQGRLTRESDRADRRRAKLYLSESGRTVHNEIVPMARAYEAELLSTLDDGERVLLDSLLKRIADRVPASVPGARAGGDGLD